MEDELFSQKWSQKRCSYWSELFEKKKKKKKVEIFRGDIFHSEKSSKMAIFGYFWFLIFFGDERWTYDQLESCR